MPYFSTKAAENAGSRVMGSMIKGYCSRDIVVMMLMLLLGAQRLTGGAFYTPGTQDLST